MRFDKNRVISTVVLILALVICARADVTVQFVAGTSAGWDFHEPAGEDVLLQTIYGTAQDSAGNITANTYDAIENLKGNAIAFAVPERTFLDKCILKCFKGTNWVAGDVFKIRFYNVTGQSYLVYAGSSGRVSRANPGGSGTLIFDKDVTIEPNMPYHSELGDGRKYTDVIINFGPMEVAGGEYLICIDRVSGSNTTGSTVVGKTSAVTDTMGKYGDGVTPLPKRATVSASGFTGNTFFYELGSSTDEYYTPRSYLYAFQITTTIINSPPVANAGSDQIIEAPNTATLSGTASDDGYPNPLTITWSKVNGPGTVTFGDASALNTTATFSDVGTYVLRLTANDGALSTYDDIQIIYTQNNAPVVNAGYDRTVAIIDLNYLDGTVTDDGLPNPPGAVTTFWTKQSGPGAVVFGDANNIDTTVTFYDIGVYVLRLTAYDGETSSYDEVTFDVVPCCLNMAPVVNAGADQEITLLANANLDGTVTDDGRPNPPGAVTAQWTKQSGSGTVTFGDASAVDTTATFSSLGTYVLRLTASDSALWDYDEVTITVSPPSAGPRRVILFYIDGLAVNVPETYMPYLRDTYIPQGCYYSASHIPLPAQPAQDNNPSSSTYYPWSCSIPNPVAMSGSVFIGISDIKTHLLQYSFTGTGKSTAFVTNDTAYQEIKGGYTYYQELSPNTNDDPIIQTAETWIQNYNPYYLRMHLQATGMGGWTDNAAGRTIWQSNSTYRQKAIHADVLLNDFITWLKNNPTPSNNYWTDTVMIIAGDHGESDWGGHDWWDPKANKTPMLIIGKGIKTGQRFDYAECVDIPATICNLLDVNVPKYCDGRVLNETYVGGPSDPQAAGYMKRVNSALIDSYNYHNANPGCHSIPLYATAYSRILPITKIARWHFSFGSMQNLTTSFEKYYEIMKVCCTGPAGTNPDLSNDGFVNLYDLEFIAGNWLESGVGIPGDIYDDQIVNMLDFALLTRYWLE